MKKPVIIACITSALALVFFVATLVLAGMLAKRSQPDARGGSIASPVIKPAGSIRLSGGQSTGREAASADVFTSDENIDTVRNYRITCPACKGKGYISEDRGDIKDFVKYGCPICHGKQKKVQQVPAGEKLCSACRGMGLTGYMLYDGLEQAKRLNARTCIKCGGRGHGK